MNKQEVRTRFLNLLNRNDCTNALADGFLDDSLRRIQRTLKIPSMEKSKTITFSEELPDSFVLPSDFLTLKDLYYYSDATGGVILERLELSSFFQKSIDSAYPQYYTRVQNSIIVKPANTDTTLTLSYYGEIPDLTSDTDSNLLTNLAPDLLIYGALSFAADYFLDSERSKLFEERYISIYREIEEQNRQLEFAGYTNTITPAYQY